MKRQNNKEPKKKKRKEEKRKATAKVKSSITLFSQTHTDAH